MQKGFSAVLILFTMLFISTFVIVGAYFVGNAKKINPSPTPQAEETNLKTYTNQKIKFSFQYPQELELKEVSTPNIELVNLFKDGRSEITVEVKDSQGKTLDEILSVDRGIVETIFSKEIKLGDQRAIQERVKAQAMGGTEVGEGVYAVKENQFIRIIYSDEIKQYIEIILNTFKFTDQLASVGDKVVGEGCKIAGCSGQGCVSADSPDVSSTCEYREVYGCYRSAECKIQSDGKCGWTQTEILKSCLQKANNEEVFCGGIAGIKCPSGYTCNLDGNYPDAGGKCILQ